MSKIIAEMSFIWVIMVIVDEWCLVHGGAGGVGIAAVQIAKVTICFCILMRTLANVG